MATPEMIAGMTAVLEGKEPSAAPEPTPAADDTPPAAVAPEGGKEDLLGEDPPAPEAAAPAEGDTPPEPAEGAPARGADGKFVAKDKKDAAPEEPKEPVAAEPAAEPDPLNDPLPEGKKERSERFQTLVGMVKEKDAVIEQVNGDMEMLMTPIREASATPEQFRESMNLVKLINSPNQQDQMRALQMLQSTTTALAQRLGQPVPGTDPLDGFPDLLNELNAGKITEARAVELANARRQTAASQNFQRQAQQRTQQEQQAAQAAQAGQAAVAAVEQTLKATDPQYAAKVEMMRRDPAFVAQLKAMHPTQWAAAFAEKYRTVKVAAPAAAPRPAAPASPQPLRAKTPAGTAGKPPGSMLDAVKAGLASVGGG